MAKIGFEYIIAAELKSGTSAANAIYNAYKEVGTGASCNIAPTANDVKDYGDDRTVATDTSVTGGTVSLELNEPTLEIEAFLLGHTYDSTAKSMLRNAESDVDPYVGMGFIGKSVNEANEKIYKVKAIYKAQFKEANDDNTTKQESTTFNHTTLEGNLFKLENGDWSYVAQYETLADAKTALQALFKTA